MKKTITIFAAVFMITSLCLLPAFSFAQGAPQAFKYQTIVRDNTGNVLANHAVSFRISLLRSFSSIVEYVETQTGTTNQFGLVNLNIGYGTIVSGNLSTINWGADTYFVQIELDATGGTNYIMMGASMLLSVPYALYAENSSVNNAWSLLGNAGTNDAINFIGTIDNKSLFIRVNNQKAGEINQFRQNTFFGYLAGNVSNISAYGNTAIGFQSLLSNINGFNNTASGFGALQLNISGAANTAAGVNALYSNTSGGGNTAIGLTALASNTIGSVNTAMGEASLNNNTTGNYNTAAGEVALWSNKTGNNNTGLGAFAGYNDSAGIGNVFLGYRAGINEGGSNKLYIANNDTPLIYGDFSAGFVGINTITPSASLEVHGTSGAAIKIVDGNQAAGFVLTSDGTGQGSWQAPSGSSNWALIGNAVTDPANFIGTTTPMPFNIKVNNDKAGRIDFDPNIANTFFGYQTGKANTLGMSNTADGFQALYLNTSGSANTAIGSQALWRNISGGSNTAIGMGALSSNTTGNDNTAIGVVSLTNNKTGIENTAIGYAALFHNISGSDNTVNGFAALTSNTTGASNTAIGTNAMSGSIIGSRNTSIGWGAGSANVSGNQNVYLGYLAGINETGSNKLYIANDSTPLIYGDFSAGYVGINTIIPSASLEVHGASGAVIKIVDGSQGAGKVLTSDGTGQGSWQTPSGGGANNWALLGNAGTIDGTNFIGTTDNVPFNIRVSNQKAGRIDFDPNFANTFLGYLSGNENTSGDGNTAEGYQSLTHNTSGNYNTGFGLDALGANITGNSNTASGLNSIENNISGNSNTAQGYQSLFSNVAGSGATAVGYNAMQYANNTATLLITLIQHWALRL